jgi:hypothetical protein
MPRTMNRYYVSAPGTKWLVVDRKTGRIAGRSYATRHLARGACWRLNRKA